MEPFLFSLIMAWALVRYGVTDLVATAKGTESPRYRERAQRLAQQHERQMARLRAGPTIGQAVAARIAHRIAQPKPPRDRSGQRPFRRFMGEWWDDAWNHATDSRHRHYERKEAGDLPRQRAARATRDAFGRWRDQWRHRHTETGSGWVPPEADTERTGPIHVVAERLPLPEAATDTEPLPDLGEVVEYPDERQAGVLGADGTVSTWPATDPDTPHDMTDGSRRSIPDVLHPEGVTGTPEERNTTPMNTPQQTTPTGEVTNIAGALDYTRGMGEQFRAAVAHAEALAAQAAQMSEWTAQSSASAETAVAGITAGEVTGDAVERLGAAHEQMIAAADRVERAAQALRLAQEQFAATADGFDIARQAFERQQTVAEAYAANPDAGSKQFNTYG